MSAAPDLTVRPQPRAPSRLSHSAFGGGPLLVTLFDVDPELGRGVPPSDWDAARVASRAQLLPLPRGPWVPEESAGFGLGYLLLSGLVARLVQVGRRESLELLTEGDVIQPWEEDELSVVECQVRWEVLADARVAQLDDRLCRMLRRWPQVQSSLQARALRRAKCHAVQAAINAHPAVWERVLLMFCHLGERTGRMCPEGIVFELPLSHRLLAEVVHAMRPSVTNALLRLRDDGLIEQRGRWRWVVTHAGLAAATQLCEQEAHGS